MFAPDRLLDGLRPGTRWVIDREPRGLPSVKRIVLRDLTDTGMGIPDAMHDRVFRLYDRLGNGIIRRTPGSGVGLHLAKQMVTAIGGQIGFSSRAGEGSLFWVDLPVCRGA